MIKKGKEDCMDFNTKQTLLAEVRQNIQELNKELAELHSVEAYLLKPERVSLQTSPPPAPRNQHPGYNQQPIQDVSVPIVGTPVNTHRFGPGTNLANAAAEILRANKRPMRSNEIADIILASGYPAPQVDSDKPRAFVNTIFSALTRRKDLFRKPSRGLWALASQNGTGEQT